MVRSFFTKSSNGSSSSTCSNQPVIQPWWIGTCGDNSATRRGLDGCAGRMGGRGAMMGVTGLSSQAWKHCSIFVATCNRIMDFLVNLYVVMRVFSLALRFVAQFCKMLPIGIPIFYGVYVQNHCGPVWGGCATCNLKYLFALARMQLDPPLLPKWCTFIPGKHGYDRY